MNTKTLLSLSAAALLALAGCSTSEPAPPPVTVTETSSTAEQQPTQTVTESAPSPEAAAATSTTEDTSIGGMAMELAWDEMDAVGQDTICSGYRIDPDATVDLFFEEVGDESYGIRRSEVTSLFEREC